MCPSDAPAPGPGTTPGGAIRGAGGFLTIDLAAIAQNWRRLQDRLREGAACAAVVKADAYGLGMDRVAPVLWDAGCRTFYVAITEEGIALRALLPDAEICVFNGPDAGCADDIAAANLTPVLNHAGQLADWRAAAGRADRALPAMVHVDTGMNRLGFSPRDAEALAADGDAFAGMGLTAVMSHLACAETPDHPLNAEQLALFRRAVAALSPRAAGGQLRASLANSSGIFLGSDYHFDQARPGAALYGVQPSTEEPDFVAQVIHLQGKILQTRVIDTPMTVGYGATHRAEPKRRLATVGVGYADGYLRSLSGVASAHIGDIRVPVVGRVSMDLITIDVTDAPEQTVRPGAYVDLIGPHHPVDAIAREAGTIGYEILTALGTRFVRNYKGGAS